MHCGWRQACSVDEDKHVVWTRIYCTCVCYITENNIAMSIYTTYTYYNIIICDVLLLTIDYCPCICVCIV